MKKNFKRVVSIFISVLMLAGMFSTQVFAFGLGEPKTADIYEDFEGEQILGDTLMDGLFHSPYGEHIYSSCDDGTCLKFENTTVAPRWHIFRDGHFSLSTDIYFESISTLYRWIANVTDESENIVWTPIFQVYPDGRLMCNGKMIKLELCMWYRLCVEWDFDNERVCRVYIDDEEIGALDISAYTKLNRIESGRGAVWCVDNVKFDAYVGDETEEPDEPIEPEEPDEPVGPGEPGDGDDIPTIVSDLIVNENEGHPGEEVAVTIRLENNSGVAAIAFDVDYNSDAMTLQRVDVNGIFAEEDIIVGDLTKNPYTVCAANYDGDMTDNGDFVTLVFVINEDCAEGEYDVSITNTDAYTYDETEIIYNITNGKIVVTVYDPGDVNEDMKVNLGDLLRLGKYLSGWEVHINEKSADVTADGKVNRMDLLRLGKYFSGWEVVLGE